MTEVQQAIPQLDRLLCNVNPFTERVVNHPVYGSLNTISDVRKFMEFHVYAVWDFMSLLKALQREFCNTDIPWLPPRNSEASRFITEIVLAEETDRDPEGRYISHFELYLEAMREIGADTTFISNFINDIRNGVPIHVAISCSHLPTAVKEFLNFTFRTIETGKTHCMAAAFSLGREDVIPKMFSKILNDNVLHLPVPKFQYYVERHIELDGEDHGPLAWNLLQTLCGDSELKWEEASETACNALHFRANLWSYIHTQLR
ncbi:MAG: DUF3050 domain-containing protein [Flavobacteriales bacterium]|nr:DUF3050 domain-containing protein [Flavobacteriales bacterium]